MPTVPTLTRGEHTHGYHRSTPGKNGQASYRVQVRRKGSSPQSASFQILAEAQKWAKIREGAVLEGRHFPSTAAKRHTVSDLLDRYISDVLPSKHTSTVYNQSYQFRWWKAQLGHCVLADVTPALLIEYRSISAILSQLPNFCAKKRGNHRG